MLNTLKQSRINIMRGKKDVTTFPDKPVYKPIKPLKSEAIHETGLSGNVVASFFLLIIFIYIYIYIAVNSCDQILPFGF